jgi:dGTPase
LLALPLWTDSFSFTLQDFARLKALTSYLIGRFVRSTVGATRKEYGDGKLMRYNANLIVLSPMREEIEVLKALAHVAIRQRPNIEAERAQQREQITGLASELVARPEKLEPIYREWYEVAADDNQRLRVVVDQVASLTDYSVLDFGRGA